MIEKLLKRLWYEKPKLEKPRPFYYECIGYKWVKKALEIIYGNKEKYIAHKKETALSQVIFTSLGDKEKIYLYRYHVIRKKATIIQWIATKDNPRYCWNKIIIK
jgi:hypothetical protein